MKISCDTIARLSLLLGRADDPIFNTLRLDNGRVVASNRKLMVIERVESFEGAYHINVPEALANQCREEAKYNSVLDITPNPVLKYTTARTTLGFDVSENIGVWSDHPTAYDDWHERIIEPLRQPVQEPSGTMIWIADDIELLARTSPSGVVVFERMIAADTRPVLMRDLNDDGWCAVTMMTLNDDVTRAPAALPGWL